MSNPLSAKPEARSQFFYASSKIQLLIINGGVGCIPFYKRTQKNVALGGGYLLETPNA